MPQRPNRRGGKLQRRSLVSPSSLQSDLPPPPNSWTGCMNGGFSRFRDRTARVLCHRRNSLSTNSSKERVENESKLLFRPFNLGNQLVSPVASLCAETLVESSRFSYQSIPLFSNFLAGGNLWWLSYGFSDTTVPVTNTPSCNSFAICNNY